MRKTIGLVLLLTACALTVSALTQRDRAILTNAPSSGAITSITVDSAWGSTTCTNGAGCTVTIPSAGTRTLTVPAGNPGTVKFTVTSSGHTWYYNKNSAGFTTFSNNATLSVSNGDTLIFKVDLNPACTTSTTVITVTDNTTAGAVGTATATNTGC